MLPRPEELAASAYDFTKQLLTSQPKFAEKRVETTKPLLGAKKTRRSARVTPSGIPHLRRPGFLAAPASTA